MTASALRDRWTTPEGQSKVEFIMFNLYSENLEAVLDVLEKTDGRWDLRGFPFIDNYRIKTKAKQEKKNAGGVFFGFNDLVFKDVDFSHSCFSGIFFYFCDFQDCLIEGMSMDNCGFYGCTFKNVVFRKCSIAEVGFGGIAGKCSILLHVTFSNSKLSDILFSCDLVLKDCAFGGKLRYLAFRGTKLNDCSFSGLLRRTQFDREYIERGRAGETDKSTFEGDLNNVDFSAARFEDVDFLGDLDLTSCKFPSGTILLHNGKEVLIKAKEVVENEWPEDWREFALSIIKIELNRVRRQSQVLVNLPQYVAYDRKWGEPQLEEKAKAFDELLRGLKD